MCLLLCVWRCCGAAYTPVCVVLVDPALQRFGDQATVAHWDGLVGWKGTVLSQVLAAPWHHDGRPCGGCLCHDKFLTVTYAFLAPPPPASEDYVTDCASRGPGTNLLGVCEERAFTGPGEVRHLLALRPWLPGTVLSPLSLSSVS